MINSDTQANLIKIGAVLTAIPRWVTALLWAEGFAIPTEWMTWWIPASAFLSVAMAVVEGFAFAYIFNIWSASRHERARGLLVIATISALAFIIVLVPSIAASVRGVEIGVVLANEWLLFPWSIAVASSTITLVISVGYAQRVQSYSSQAEQISSDASNGKATVENWRTIYQNMNGDKRQMDADAVKELLEEHGYELPGTSTLYNWAKEANVNG